MGWRETLDAALDGTGPPTVVRGGVVAEIDVVEADRIGVRVRSVRVTRAAPVDVAEEAERLATARGLPDPVVPVEVAPTLGGAVLRTRPDAIDDRTHTEVRVTPGTTEVTRQRVQAEGGREPVAWDLTREGLGRLLDAIAPEPAS